MQIQDAGRQMYLATLGAAGMVANGSKAVAEMAWAEARRFAPSVPMPDVPAMIKGARKPMREAMHTVEDAVESTTKTVLTTLGVPTRNEVTTLTRRVEHLIKKVDAMQPVRRRRVAKATPKVTKRGTRRGR